MEGEEKEHKKEENEERDWLPALGSLLDFYSDKSNAHASFLLAVIFGMFMILGIHVTDQWKLALLGAIYGLLGSIGPYLFLSFWYYSDLSEAVKDVVTGSTLRGMEKRSIEGLYHFTQSAVALRWRNWLLRGFYRLKAKSPPKIEKIPEQWRSLVEMEYKGTSQVRVVGTVLPYPLIALAPFLVVFWEKHAAFFGLVASFLFILGVLSKAVPKREKFEGFYKCLEAAKSRKGSDQQDPGR